MMMAMTMLRWTIFLGCGFLGVRREAGAGGGVVGWRGGRGGGDGCGCGWALVEVFVGGVWWWRMEVAEGCTGWENGGEVEVEVEVVVVVGERGGGLVG